MERREQREGWQEDQTFFLEPGAVYFGRESGVVRAVLGNGVAVCLWDRLLKCGGMTYFLQPSVHEASKAVPLYGNVAILALIGLVEDAGGRAENLTAQIIGGAIPEEEEGNRLGEENVLQARKILVKKGVKIFSEDVGGHMGRKVVFDVATGHAAVFKVHRVRKGDWFKKL